MVPSYCTLQQGNPAAQKCDQNPYQVLAEQSRFCDQQQLKLQEKPEDVPTGEMPRHVSVVVDRHLVGKVTPGTRVTILGIYSAYKVSREVVCWSHGDTNKQTACMLFIKRVIRVMVMVASCT